jgi:hypothetical protein
MKKTICFISLLVAVTACNKESLDVQPMKSSQDITKISQINDPILEKDYLVFDNPKAFFTALQDIKMMFNLEGYFSMSGEKWQKIEGFMSLEEDFNEKVSQKEKLDGQENTAHEIKDLNISIPALAKVVNPNGIVKIGKSLYLFSKNYNKVIPYYNGTENEIKMIISNDKSLEKKLIVSKLKTSDKQARYSDFNIYDNRTEDVYYYVGPAFYRTWLRCNITGRYYFYQNYCSNEDDPALQYFYPCDWRSYYRLDVLAGRKYYQAGVTDDPDIKEVPVDWGSVDIRLTNYITSYNHYSHYAFKNLYQVYLWDVGGYYTQIEGVVSVTAIFPSGLFTISPNCIGPSFGCNIPVPNNVFTVTTNL